MGESVTDIQLIPAEGLFRVFPLTARGLAWLRGITNDELWRNHDGFEHINVAPEYAPALLLQAEMAGLVLDIVGAVAEKTEAEEKENRG
jgi:hypothetical protein